MQAFTSKTYNYLNTYHMNTAKQGKRQVYFTNRPFGYIGGAIAVTPAFRSGFMGLSARFRRTLHRRARVIEVRRLTDQPIGSALCVRQKRRFV